MRLIERLPYLVVLTILTAYAAQGTALPVDPLLETIFQVAAGIAAALVAVTAVAFRWRVASGVGAIVWFMAWGFVVFAGFFPARVQLGSAMLFPAVATLIAWGWGRAPIRRPWTTHRPTRHEGENLTPHYTPRRR